MDLKKGKLICASLTLLLFIPLIFTSCKKTGVSQNNNGTKNSDTTKVTTNAINPLANANAAYDGFVGAFVVRSGGNTFITNGLVDRSTAYMWGQGFMITALEDAYDRTKSGDRKQLVSDLLNTFITNNGTDWSWDSWNDDVAWAIIPFIRGYQITANPVFLNIAAQNWKMAWTRGWDNVTGGGIWENQDKLSKAALSNDPSIIAGCFLYESTGDTSYLNKCKLIYGWVRNSLFNDTTGVVNEALTTTGMLQPSDNAYNCGSFINAATSLYKLTNNKQYYDDAILAADHIVTKFGVMNEEADGCVRAIAKLASENNLGAKYNPWLVRQCIASWNNRRTDYNITNNDWRDPTPAGEQYAMQCISAVTVQSVTPEAAMITVPDGSYKIVSRSSSLALNADGVDNNTPLNIETYSNTIGQHWALTGLGGGLYKLLNVGSSKSINVSGNSGDNNAALILWDYDSAGNELVYFSSAATGYYSMFVVNSGKALTVNGTDQGAAIVQSAYTESSNQQWQFLKP